MARTQLLLSRDIDEIDTALPVHLKDVLNQLFVVAGLIFILCFVSPYILLAIVPLIGVFLFIQTAYLRSSRQLKRLMAINRCCFTVTRPSPNHYPTIT